jgi:beta-glucanase (GH16 family)
VSVVGGNLNLHSSGANGSCAVVAGTTSYLYGVFEYRINVPTYKGLIANWPAAWLVGGAWDAPSYQELDAFEGSIGHDSASYWTGSGAPAGDDVTGYTTNGSIDAYGMHGVGIPALGPAITFGWNTVDVVWSPTGFSVYANGKRYAQMPASEATPMKIVLDNTEGPNGLQPAGHASDFQVAYARVWSYAG